MRNSHSKCHIMTHQNYRHAAPVILVPHMYGILCHITPEYVFLPESRTPKTQIRLFLKIWQEPGLGTKLKICVKEYRTIIKHNIEGTFHGQIQPISWRTKILITLLSFLEWSMWSHWLWKQFKRCIRPISHNLARIYQFQQFPKSQYLLAAILHAILNN